MFTEEGVLRLYDETLPSEVFEELEYLLTNSDNYVKVYSEDEDYPKLSRYMRENSIAECIVLLSW